MISVVIPSYNRKDCILDLLRDVYLQQDAEFEVIVVDDASPDGTVDAIRNCFPQVRLFVNEKNGGPCVSRNRGVRDARGDLIVGLDSDVTVPDRHLLAKVSAAFQEDSRVSGFAFRVFASDGLTDDKPRWWHPVLIEKGRERRFETDYFSGTAYAFRRNIIIEAGLFPEFLYMYNEEVELAYRILDLGATISYRPNLSVVHHANPISRRSLVQVYLKPRNQILLAVSCFPPGRLLTYTVTRTAYQFAKAVKGGHFADFRRALKDAIAKSREIERRPLKPSTMARINRLRSEL